MTMTDVETLLQTYIERFEAGDSPDPTDLLEQTEGRDRARLSTLIEGYLEHAAPRQRWDAKAFEGSVASRAVEMLQTDWAEQTSALSAQLVALRKQKQIERKTLVATLAEKLGFPKEADRVAAYYNAIEHGQLEPRGISSKVFDALASVLDTSADALRKAGEAVSPSAGGMASPAFTRTTPVEVTPDQLEGAASPGKAMRSETPEAEQLDDLDRLFLGGEDE